MDSPDYCQCLRLKMTTNSRAWYSRAMPTKPKKKHSGRRGDPVSLAPLTMDEAVDAIFQISPKDVKRIVASRPGKKGKAK